MNQAMKERKATIANIKVYKCTDCGARTYLKDNGEVTVGYCKKCGHPLWNPAEQSFSDIDYHFKRVKSIQHHSFDIAKGNLMARVFLRHTGSICDQKGNYIINEKDLFAWFENLDYLRIYSEFDTF